MICSTNRIERYMNLTHDQLKEISRFLSDYAVTLLACGATTMRIEKNIERMAQHFHTHVEITIFPLHSMLTVWDENHNHSYTNNSKIKNIGLDFSLNTRLSELSWNIADCDYTLEKSQSEYNEIISKPRMNKYLVLLLVGFANASFCRLFGGDFASMLVVFFATLDGFYIKNKIHGEWKCDIRLATIVSGFVAAIISSACFLFNIGSTPEIALGTSVLFLIPGIPFINSVHDLIHGHYICCLSRCIQATIITICLSIGLCAALLILNLELH